MPIATTPFTEPEWKMPGYTGYIQGLGETFGKTPVIAQQQTKDPVPCSFLHTRKTAAPVTTPIRDPCNFPDTYKPAAEPANLWPSLQSTGKQESAKPPSSHLALGDGRINPFVSSYKSDYGAPFAAGARIRSPLRNKILKDVADLHEVYRSAFQRVGEKRLSHMLVHMKERLAGKIGNANDNAFKLRRLFKMYDTSGSGYIEIEDFRVMTESFGMQLDDDSLLALFSRFDPEATGVLEYMGLMKGLLDSDYYALYLGAVDNTQTTKDAADMDIMAADLNKRFTAVATKLKQVFVSFDESQSGYLDERSLMAACAACNILLSEREQAYVLSVMDPNATNRVSYDDFMTTFCC
ncbi:hypothetical protein WJX72_001201 [[Myrmecia] bisecta]|uniref:EF-hand domain-containing protein n=1 Tax=[Myrmecia] bisecta TaxID=41462 RepID=A0AAW1PKV8_9CHLO